MAAFFVGNTATRRAPSLDWQAMKGRRNTMSVTRWMVAVVGVVLVQSVLTTHITGQASQPRQFNYDHYEILGLGTADCGKMTSDLRTNRERYTNFYLFWTQGFITGANWCAAAAKQGNPRVGEDTSPDALLAAMEQFCGQHPLNKVADAAGIVYLQLAER
jgi:hypothetical protein